MKDQITHLPDNADRSVAKQKFKITNWPTYNKALINRGSITFWLDDEAIQAWYESATPSSRGRPQRYSDLAITTVLGYSAMSGIIGGGGLGKIAINYGYYRYKYLVMYAAVILLILLVQLFQSVGTKLAAKCDKRLKNR